MRKEYKIMSVALEFYNFLIPISTVERKYPGGWERCLKDYEDSSAWYDGYLLRLGSASSMDVEDIADEWKKMKFKGAELKDGRLAWEDFCILEPSAESWPCEWLETDPERSRAYLKGTDPDGIVYGMLFPEEFCGIGAMIGDIAGSGYERDRIKYRPPRLIRGRADFTGDTVLTYGVALGIIEGMKKVDRSAWLSDPAMQAAAEKEIERVMRDFARRYPDAGYGKAFGQWLRIDPPEPYGSWGNGSAMRVSFAGWYANSLEEAEMLARVSARFTHGHPEGVKGAVAAAGCIYLLRTGHGKEEVRDYAKKYYDLGFTLDEIRPSYRRDVSCAGTVPQAIVAFLENDSFEDVIRAAISLGGDSGTLAAIAGSLAEAFYPIPVELTLQAWKKLDSGIKFAVRTVTEVLRQR
jgi:ADP-ribosylglycohydrolase